MPPLENTRALCYKFSRGKWIDLHFPSDRVQTLLHNWTKWWRATELQSVHMCRGLFECYFAYVLCIWKHNILIYSSPKLNIIRIMTSQNLPIFERHWVRPDLITNFPKIWDRFTTSDRNEHSYKIRIQDVTPDLHDEVWDVMKNYF